MAQINLPFKVGQLVEVKSFEDGYRGAWFKCKIVKIYTKEEKLHYSLEYLDFPDEHLHETQVYQKFQDGEEECLMVRPPYPPHCHESQLPKTKSDQEPLIVAHRSWKAGDLVDWWKDDCYWSGTVLRMRGDQALQVELTPPPRGEGKNYRALRKDLCPSLEWSPEDGWKLPSMDGHKRQCAKLVKRENEDQTDSVKKHKVMTEVCDSGREETNTAKKKKTESSTEGQLIGDEDLRLNITESDSIEAAVFDLEELIVRIEWLKGMLSPDVGEEASKAYWKYEDYRPGM